MGRFRWFRTVFMARFMARFVAGCMAVGLVTGLAVTVGVAIPTASAPPARAATAFPVLQLNLCRSGVAGCYNQGGYNPISRAVDRIVSVDPQVVTINEACSGELTSMVEQILNRSGRTYKLVWRWVGRKVGSDPIAAYPCTDGRGSYAIAVLGKQGAGGVGTYTGAVHGIYSSQDSGSEKRAYLCAKFSQVNACTTHLTTDNTAVAEQCASLKSIMTNLTGATVFGGDLNLTYPARAGEPSAQACVPSGFTRKGDGDVQHIMASNRFTFSSSAAYTILGTDHPAWRVTWTW